MTLDYRELKKEFLKKQKEQDRERALNRVADAYKSSLKKREAKHV